MYTPAASAYSSQALVGLGSLQSIQKLQQLAHLILQYLAQGNTGQACGCVKNAATQYGVQPVIQALRQDIMQMLGLQTIRDIGCGLGASHQDIGSAQRQYAQGVGYDYNEAACYLPAGPKEADNMARCPKGSVQNLITTLLGDPSLTARQKQEIQCQARQVGALVAGGAAKLGGDTQALETLFNLAEGLIGGGQHEYADELAGVFGELASSVADAIYGLKGH